MIEEAERQLMEKINLVENIFHKKHGSIPASQTPYYLDGMFEAARAYRNASQAEIENLKQLAIKQNAVIKQQDYALERLKRESGEITDAKLKLQKIQQVLGVELTKKEYYEKPKDERLDPYAEIESDFDNFSKEHGEIHEKIQNENIQEKLEENFKNTKEPAKIGLIKKIRNTLDISWGKAENIADKQFKKEKDGLYRFKGE